MLLYYFVRKSLVAWLEALCDRNLGMVEATFNPRCGRQDQSIHQGPCLQLSLRVLTSTDAAKKFMLRAAGRFSCKCSETPVIHAHIVERLDSTNEQNAPTRVHMYTHMRAYINVYAYIYTDIHIYKYIHIHMHYTHIHAHTYTYACICTRMHR